MFYFQLANMESSRVVRASGCQCQSHNSPEFDPSILRHSDILGAEDEAVLNNVHKQEEKIQKTTFKHFIFKIDR
jgi:hypothetical protein